MQEKSGNLVPLIDPCLSGSRVLLYIHHATQRRFMLVNRPDKDGKERWYVVEDIPKDALLRSMKPSKARLEIGRMPACGKVHAGIPRIRNNAIWYHALEDALDAIQEAVDLDCWYDDNRPPLRADYMSLERARKERSLRYWRSEKKKLESAMRQATRIDPLFCGARNIIGPLEQEVCLRIRRYIDRPSLKEWKSIRSIMITPRSTLWRAWAHDDPAAPQNALDPRSDTLFPSGPALVRAISGEIQRDRFRIEESLARCLEEGKTQNDTLFGLTQR